MKRRIEIQSPNGVKVSVKVNTDLSRDETNRIVEELGDRISEVLATTMYLQSPRYRVKVIDNHG